MKRIISIMMTIFILGLSGCATRGGSAAGGAVAGGAGSAGAYEYRLHQEMKRIEDEYKAGKIDQKEYEIRKDQIQRMSVVQ